MSYLHYERLYDFSGGLNNRDADSLLQDNESPDMCNMMLGKRGTFETRKGTVLFRNDPVVEGKPTTSIFEHVDDSGKGYFMAFAGGELKVATEDGWEKLPPIATHLKDGSYLDTVSNPIVGKTLFVNGEDGYFETDGSSFNEVGAYSPTEQEKTEIGECNIPGKPTLIAYHNYRTWLANVDGYPNRVYFSADDITGNTMYNYFTATNWLQSSTAKGEEITALVSFRDRLYAFTRTTIKVISGKDVEDFTIISITDKVGAVSSRTVCNFGDYLVFLGVDGVYIFDGVNVPMKISMRQAMTIEAISSDYRNRSCGVLHQGKYYLSVPESTVNDVTLVYDTEVVPLTYIGDKHSYANTPWTLDRGYTLTQWLVGRDLNLYFASDDGYVYQYGIGDTDVGKPIDAYYTTKLMDLGMPDRAKRVRRLILDVRREKNKFMQIEYKTDAEDSDWQLFRREIDLSKPIDAMFFYFPDGRGPLCRKIAFKFSTVYEGSRFRVNGVTLDIAVRGHQEERS